MNKDCDNSVGRALIIDKSQNLRKISQLSGRMFMRSLSEIIKLWRRAAITTPVRVGSDEENLQTNVYKMRVYANDSSYSTIVSVVGIPKISDSMNSIDIQGCAQVLGIDCKSIRRNAGPIDILLGVENPVFHDGPLTTVNGLSCRQTILGPVLFGDTSNSSDSTFGVDGSESSRPLHHATLHTAELKLAEPVDLSRFWDCETMGVAINPCCVHKNNEESGKRGSA
jgi:hypothetical protein